MFEEVSSSSSEIESNLNIIFVDSQVDSYSNFISEENKAETIVIDRESDGIAQITLALSQYQNVSSIQIISHGSEGRLQIGTTDLSLSNINEYQEELRQWSNYLDQDADLLLMGCKIGSEIEFIESLSELTTADVAASNNLTGYKDLNGDWQLEINLGEIESELSIDYETLADYQSVLEIPQSELVLELDFDYETNYFAVDSAPDGNNNAGRLLGDAAFRQDVLPFNGVVELDGDDLVAIANAPEINAEDRDSRTVSVWFKAEDIHQDTPQVIYQEGGGSRGLNIYLDSGQIYVGGWNQPITQWSGTFLASDNISSDNWHHVALVLDAQTEHSAVQPEVLFAYLDGVEIGRGAGSQVLGSKGKATFGGLDGSTRLHTGNTSETNALGLIGAIDEARIYNQALSATEIVALANLESPPANSDRLVAQLKLDEVSGNRAYDSHKNHLGILQNGAFFEPVGQDLGNGIRFDGDDDLVKITSSKELNFDIHAQRTISVWFNADDIDSDTPQVIYEEGGGGRGLNLYLDRGQLYVGGWNRPESNWSGTFINTDLVSPNTWHHVALVLDAQAEHNAVQPEVLFAYLDGVEIGRGAGSQVWEHGAIALGGVNFGTRFHRDDVDSSNIYGFAGNIADLEIYNQALSADQIDELTNLRTPPRTPQRFTADNELFNYDGRIDWQDPQSPVLGYPGTSIELKFTGTKLQIELSEDSFGRENYVDVYLDDRPEPFKIKLLRNGNQPVTYDIVEGLENKVHNAVIYKRTDYSTGEFKFHSVTIDGKLLPANPDSQRAIEVYGDSITAGIAVEYPFTGVQDPQVQDKSDIANAYYSYGSILARTYDAEVSLVAQAGISLVDGFSRNRFWQDIGGETIYDKIKPLQNADLWNFNNYSPDLVIIAYGQNDAASVGDSLSKQEWKEHYKQMIANLRNKHPESYFIGMFPAMFHNPLWDSYITEAIAEYRLEYDDERVFSLIHEQVTPGHPRIAEQETMAETLQEFIDGTLVDYGFNWDIG
ncbi:MAG: DUF4347 domain-containing protein [Cyanobacteria bacterium P01_G01_bin.19]